jgi:hypothetical protein
MNERIKTLCQEAFREAHESRIGSDGLARSDGNPYIFYEKFAKLIILECIDKIETHRIPVGNSAAGEMACEWTYAALKELRDEIKEHFGMNNEKPI